MVSSNAVLAFTVTLTVVMLLVATGITIFFFPKDDSEFGWKQFSVFVLFTAWFSLVAVGGFIGVVNVLNESDLREKNRQLKQLKSS